MGVYFCLGYDVVEDEILDFVVGVRIKRLSVVDFSVEIVMF